MHEPNDHKTVPVDGDPPRRGGNALTIACAIALVGAAGYAVYDRMYAAPVQMVETEAASTEPKGVVEPPPTEAEIAAAKAEQHDDDMEYAVRQQLCLDYGERYVAARTGVELVKAVQLSQAAGCDWKGMLHADAATHDFVPEAVQAMRRLDASSVTTGGSATEEDAERIDRIDRSMKEIDRKVDQLRYRVR